MTPVVLSSTLLSDVPDGFWFLLSRADMLGLSKGICRKIRSYDVDILGIASINPVTGTARTFTLLIIHMSGSTNVPTTQQLLYSGGKKELNRSYKNEAQK